jgi:hypothetical protein
MDRSMVDRLMVDGFHERGLSVTLLQDSVVARLAPDFQSA